MAPAVPGGPVWLAVACSRGAAAAVAAHHSGRGLCRRGFAELGDVLGLGRMLSLLPFFVLALLQPRHLSALTVVVSLVAAVPAAHYVDCAWFSWRSSLVDRGIDPLGLGLLSRSGCMLAALALTLALRPG
ncbi:hypothetical protein Tfu_2438 [Thermobifida fusca YX]|nr:hypothetical protein Tfu_2438 [Thermobifida fusca YX]